MGFRSGELGGMERMAPERPLVLDHRRATFGKDRAGHVRQPGHRRVPHRDVELVALPRPFPAQQRHQDRGQRRHRPGDVGDRHMRVRRLAVAVKVQADDTREGLDGQIMRRGVAQRAGLAEGRDGTADDARIDLCDGLMARARTVHHARTERLDHHIRRFGQPQEVRDVGGVLEVQLDRPLAAMGVAEPHACADVAVADVSDGFAGGRFDLVDLGPHVGQIQRGKAVGFLKTRVGLEEPDIHITLVPGLNPEVTTRGQGWHGYLINFRQLRPESRGALQIASPDPLTPPRIEPRYLNADADRRCLRDGLRLARRIGANPALSRRMLREMSPTARDVESDAAMDGWVRAGANTIFHPVGTCRMAADVIPGRAPLARAEGV